MTLAFAFFTVSVFAFLVVVGICLAILGVFDRDAP